MIAVPNPSSGQVFVFFSLNLSGNTSLLLEDLAGETVGNWNLGEEPSGTQRTKIDVSNMAPGIYFLILQSDEGTGWQVRSTFKIAIIRP
jgi:hypothetical protein